MPDALPTPWDFDDETPSPDNFHKLAYYNLTEIAMGAPIAGECYLETNDKRKIKIPNRCGGPPVWETAGQLVAVPLWIRHARGGLVQQLGVVNVIKKELTIFSRRFGVLNLSSFDKTLIYEDKKLLPIKIQKERIDKIIQLVE